MSKPRTRLALLGTLLALWVGAAAAQELPDHPRFDAPVTLETGADGLPLKATLHLLAASAGLTPVIEGVPDVTVAYNIPDQRPFRQVWDLVLGLQDLEYLLLDEDIVVVAPANILAGIRRNPEPEPATAPDPATEAPAIVDAFYDLPHEPGVFVATLATRYPEAHIAVLEQASSLFVSAPADQQAGIAQLLEDYNIRVGSKFLADQLAAANQPVQEPVQEPAPLPNVIAYYSAVADLDATAALVAQVAPTAAVTTMPESGVIAVSAPQPAQEEIADAIARLAALQQASREDATREFFELSYGNPDQVLEALRTTLGNDVLVALDPDSRTIVVTGTRAQLDAAREVVTSLDRQLPQVTVQVRIQEVSTEANERLGINLASDIGLLALNFAEAGLNFLLNPGAAVTSLNINATLDILERQNLSRNIQDAHLTLVSGTQGNFTSGGRIDLVLPNAAGEATIRTVEYGTLITVTPVVTRDGKVRLDVKAGVSGFEGELSSLDGIEISTRELETRVITENGQALVIGGLLENTVQVTESGVPILSRLPIIGGLFRTTGSTERASDVMIVIKVDVHDQPLARN